MKRAALLAVVLASLATPSLATEWLNCVDDSGENGMDMLLSLTGGLQVSAITLRAGTAQWSSGENYGPGDAIALEQGVETADQIIADAVDGDFTHLAELRLSKTSNEDGDNIVGGTLRVIGHGAWAVSCSGM